MNKIKVHGSQLVLELQDAVNHLYPQGKIRQEIIEEAFQRKINECDASNDQEQWCLLCDDVYHKFNGFSIECRGEFEFPSYKISISIFKDSVNGIEMEIKLVAKISLLARYFTIFYENSTEFTGLGLTKFAHPLKIFVLSGTGNTTVIKEDFLVPLRDSISSMFVNYKFVPHDLLFSFTLPGLLPHGGFEGIYDQYSSYSLLFGTEYDHRDHRIVK